MSETIVVFDVVEVEATPVNTRQGRDTVRGGDVTRSGKTPGQTALRAVDVQLEELGDNLVGFIHNIGGMLARVAERESAFQVEKVEVQAQISAEGKVGFMGTGTKAGGGASLKIVLARRKDLPDKPETSETTQTPG